MSTCPPPPLRAKTPRRNPIDLAYVRILIMHAWLQLPSPCMSNDSQRGNTKIDFVRMYNNEW